MLLAAVPQSQSIKNELIATRQLTPQGILYKVLGVYQPGGLGERSSILTALGRPDTRTPTRGDQAEDLGDAEALMQEETVRPPTEVAPRDKPRYRMVGKPDQGSHIPMKKIKMSLLYAR